MHNLSARDRHHLLLPVLYKKKVYECLGEFNSAAPIARFLAILPCELSGVIDPRDTNGYLVLGWAKQSNKFDRIWKGYMRGGYYRIGYGTGISIRSFPVAAGRIGRRLMCCVGFFLWSILEPGPPLSFGPGFRCS